MSSRFTNIAALNSSVVLLLSTLAFSAGTPAAMLSPIQGSTLPGSTATFTWTTGSNVTHYVIYIGTTPGARDVRSVDTGLSTTVTIEHIPTTGKSLYVTLYSWIDGVAQSNAYSYAQFIGTPASIWFPSPGDTLTGSQGFSWTGGSNVTEYVLYVGTSPGARDIFSKNTGTETSTDVQFMPINGEPVYATLYSRIGSGLQSNSYVYNASTNTPPAMTSPTPNSTLSGSTVTFTWSSGTASGFVLYAGTTAGAHDVANIHLNSTSTTVKNIPTNGGTLYVTLYYGFPVSNWRHIDYTYTEATTP